MSFLKKLVKPFAVFLSVFVKQCIVFESVPDFSDNTMAVFDELSKLGFEKKYYFIWQTDYDRIAHYGNNSEWPISKPKNLTQLFMSVSFKYKRKCNIFCNICYPKSKHDEPIYYLCHGTPMKSVRDYYNMPDYVDYVITTSETSSLISEYEYKIPKEKCIPLGYPRNDSLINSTKDIRTALKTKCKRIIVWYPTYRQNKNNNFHISEKPLNIVSDRKAAQSLNVYAKERDVLIVIKPHFAQDLSYFNFSELSNIKRIDDSFFAENGLTSYEFVGACDALLTDYSSIYYDFAICDKPIGLIWADFDEYASNPGFIEDYERLTAGGEKIYNIDELCAFIDSVSKGIDKLKEKRKKICNEMNDITDGSITERVTNFIIDKSNL